MNATSLDALRNGTEPRQEIDDRMVQVRDLLVGDHIKASEARLSSLEARMHVVETELARRFDTVSARLEALAGEINSEHRTAFNELATSIGDLGERIRNIAKP